jgi:hypothetical protein
MQNDKFNVLHVRALVHVKAINHQQRHNAYYYIHYCNISSEYNSTHCAFIGGLLLLCEERHSSK